MDITYLGHQFKKRQNKRYSYRCQKCNIIAYYVNYQWENYDDSEYLDISCNEYIIKNIIE
jgi:predicted SprT family Zn-dependent metalloprotease